MAGLVINAEEAVSTERLIEFVWGDDPPPTARKSLHVYVSRLRRVLGETAVTYSSGGYLLRVDEGNIDARRFEQLAEEGRRRMSTDPQAAFDLLDQALSLWRGSPLSDIAAEGDLIPYIERLEEARQAATEDRIESALALGRHGELVGELRTLVEAHPLRERLWGQLMVALYRSGRQAEALRAFQRCRQILAEELGIEPSLPLQQLEERVLQQDPALDLDTPTPARDRGESFGPLRNPYKGLRAFTETDASDFFGRESMVTDLVSRIEAGERFLALVGPSGSGKSSVALAGVIPAVQGPDRLVTRMTPGLHPIAHLEAALTRLSPDRSHPVSLPTGDRLGLLRAVLSALPEERTEMLLVIDQFEELLTGAIGADTVTDLLGNISEAVEDPHGRLTVLVTLRSDFFDQALRLPDLAQLLDSGVVNVPPLSASDMQAAVIRPAQSVGLEIEPELVTELISEASQNPGSLPLLQFVLTELTDRAEGRTLTLAALRLAGGIQGTLAHQSEALFESLSQGGKEAARLILLHLVSLNEEGEPTRRVAIVDDLELPSTPEGRRHEALDALVEGRLLTVGRDERTGQPTVEVAHEAVFREWPRCQRWIENAKADIRALGELERAAADWVGADRSPDYLLKGSRLRLYEDWAERTELGTTAGAAGFVEASLKARRDEEEAEEARRSRERTLERRAVTRLQVSVAVLALLAVVATGLSVFAARQSREAEQQREAALTAASQMLARQLSFAAVVEAGRDPELSLLLGLHAVRAASVGGDPVPVETVEALHWGLQGMKLQYPVTDADVFLLVGPAGTRGAYDLQIDQLVDLARQRVTRQLTPEECRTFLSSGQCPELPGDLSNGVLVEAAPPEPGDQMLDGTTVSVMGALSDVETAALRAEFDAFTEETGIRVTFGEGSFLFGVVTGELPQQPDIVLASQPGWVQTEAEAGRLIDLGAYLPQDQVKTDYGDYLTSLATVGPGGVHPSPTGTLYGVPLNMTTKSQIWFVPENFEAAGYEIPATWDELIDLSDLIVADGGTPWCFAEESGPASGWPGTDWVEDILLHEHGPEVYDGWVRGDVPFSDPRVRDAFEHLGELFFTSGYVNGGAVTAIETSYADAPAALLSNPPGCWLHHQASFLPNFIADPSEVGRVSAFPTPSIDDAYANGLLTGADFAVVYTDRPEVRALMRWLASPDFGTEMAARLPGYFPANRRFNTDIYHNDWRETIAAIRSRSVESDSVRFDASDLMPEEIGSGGFTDGMIQYFLEGLDSLDTILADLDAIAAQARP
jgi:DNA-binding SARP family transcriptional activator/ABC-type glycerol-3-phosphate transport system substrate-binding protein/energy-coupling factor transporter ATP-binding protein EcfA2